MVPTGKQTKWSAAFSLFSGSWTVQFQPQKEKKKIDPLRREIRKEVFFLSVGDAALRLCSSRKALMRLCTPAEFSFVPTTFFFSPLCFFPSLSLNEQLYRHRVRLFHALQTKMQLSFDRSGDLPVLILTLHGRTAVESRGRFKRRIFFFSIKRTTRVLDQKPNENKSERGGKRRYYVGKKLEAVG